MQNGRYKKGYVVRISESALIQMALSALEAYSVTHLRKGPKKQLETYGALWGHEVMLPNGQTLYAVEMASVDTAVRMGPDSVEINPDALELKRDLMTSFWPQQEFLGDFHTHPYPAGEDVAGNQWYHFSPQDHAQLNDNGAFWRSQGYRVGLVLSITAMKRASNRRHRWLEESAIEFTLGNYRLWLKAYVTIPEGEGLRVIADDDQSVVLDCPALMGLVGEYTPFGRAVTGRGPGHRVGWIDMSGQE